MSTLCLGCLQRFRSASRQPQRLLQAGNAQHSLQQAAGEVIVLASGTVEQSIDIDALPQQHGARDEFEDVLPVLAQKTTVNPAEPLLVASPLRRKRDKRSEQ